MLRRLSATAAAVGVVLLSGCSQPRPVATTAAPSTSITATSITAPAPVRGDQVSIDGFAFAPVTLTVPVGTTVTWTNRDEEPHTVAASDGSFRSPGMGTGATFAHTFSAAGSFDYVCSIHPMMRGTVVVTG
ncbi:cupredoxin family copper-binding protein [Mycobacterium sp. E2479]|uniref:cupredoxin domain-containing protein n=1 Tax=Mycobacterium sp. E2479 TaxID=1834134 RepID=UPI0007FB8DBD|nr:cupredoxin family copper-binding protein [Mycobacterium sp. E2479]OBH64484.1 amidase [Mycobacterium sp. E2479]